MDKVFIFFWCITETYTAFLLVKGLSDAQQIFGFVLLHGVTVFLTYMVFLRLTASDHTFQDQLKSKGFILFIAVVSIVPVIGPAISLFTLVYLRYWVLIPIRSESFRQISRDALVGLQQQLESRTIPVTEALLLRQLSKDEALRMLVVIDEMEWNATKSGILKYVIRLSPHQNIVLLAIDILKKKTDAIFSEIGTLDSQSRLDIDTLRRLANLYHEICYLDLCEPVMKPFYLEKAGGYAVMAFRKGKHTEDDALLAVKYLLEVGRADDAYKIYSLIQNRGGYFVPKWVPYEFELSVRRTDIELFNNLYLLIESGGGVFVPDKVKKAATAWKKILTSAWL